MEETSSGMAMAAAGCHLKTVKNSILDILIIIIIDLLLLLLLECNIQNAVSSATTALLDLITSAQCITQSMLH